MILILILTAVERLSMQSDLHFLVGVAENEFPQAQERSFGFVI